MPLFLLDRHRRVFAAGEAIDGRRGKDKRELELGDRTPEHREVNRRARLHTVLPAWWPRASAYWPARRPPARS